MSLAKLHIHYWELYDQWQRAQRAKRAAEALFADYPHDGGIVEVLQDSITRSRGLERQLEELRQHIRYTEEALKRT